MASCADCVHVDVCRHYINSYAEIAGVDIPAALFEDCLNGDVCEQFKDRSRFVELEKCENNEIITLDDAITHCYDIADGKTGACEDCRAGYMMLGSWLRELKLRREQELQNSPQLAALPYPVKPGDELWYILDGLGEIDLKDYQTTGGDCAVGDEPDIVFDVSTRGFWISGLRKRDAEAVSFEDCFFVSWDEIGKMYFLSREEAEEALKEREEDESKGAGVSDR